MFRKISTVFMCAVVLLSFVACGKDETQQNNSTKAQTDVTTVDSISITEDINAQTDVSVTDDISTEASFTTETISAVSSDEITSEESLSETDEPTENSTSVFETENIERITFYAYYGTGIGSDVPAESLAEITAWLDSFKIDVDRKVPELLPPGTNTIHVEIEYSDGSIIKCGMDTAVINGATYYISGDSSPECYDEIISKTSLG